MAIKIHKKSFSGNSKVFDGFLASVIMGIVQAQTSIQFNAITDITDSSTGSAGVMVAALPPSAAADVEDGDGAVTKANAETALGTARKATRELLGRLNVIVGAVSVFEPLTDSIGGTAPGTTISAVTKSVTVASSGADLASYAGAFTALHEINARLEQARVFVNHIRAAVGLAAIPSVVTGVGISPVFDAVSTDTGAASTGEAVILKADLDAALVVIANNIATLAAGTNEALNATVALSVVTG